MTTPSRHERGLGYKHVKRRDYLLRTHTNGSPCYWCGESMFREPEANPDGAPLEADHQVARSHGGTEADRLLHSTCNRSRGDGTRDHLRPAETGMSTQDATFAEKQLGTRVMPWPV